LAECGLIETAIQFNGQALIQMQVNTAPYALRCRNQLQEGPCSRGRLLETTAPEVKSLAVDPAVLAKGGYILTALALGLYQVSPMGFTLFLGHGGSSPLKFWRAFYPLWQDYKDGLVRRLRSN
jgi:hypothetical protein